MKKVLKMRRKKKKEEKEAKPPVKIEPLDEIYEVVEEYKIRGDYGKVVIAKDPTGKFKYFVVEEPLTQEEEKMLKKVMDDVRFKLLKAPEEDIVKVALDRAMEMLKENVNRDKLAYYIDRDYLGYGPVHLMILDPNLEDISCNGINTPIYVWHRKYESIESNVIIQDHEYLRSFIRSIAARCGKHISGAFPILDATLPEGYRFTATLDEVSTKGSSFTIRKFRERPFTIVELIKDGVIDSTLAAFFWYMIENKRTFMIIGATGSGKTTLLNALLTFIHPSMKVCTVEETREITLPIKNWVPFVARKSYAIGEAVGEVDLFDLVKVCLRYRPDYIVVGEVRGGEAYVLFQAMQSGHGGTSTMHAETLDGMLNRLTSPPMNIPPHMIPTLNFILHISRIRMEGVIVRRVIRVWEVRGVDDFAEIAVWDPTTDTFTHRLWDSRILTLMAEQIGISSEEALKEVMRRKTLLDYLTEHNIIDYDEIAKWIYAYYADPEGTLEKARILRKIEVRKVEEVTRAKPKETQEIISEEVIEEKIEVPEVEKVAEEIEEEEKVEVKRPHTPTTPTPPTTEKTEVIKKSIQARLISSLRRIRLREDVKKRLESAIEKREPE